TEHRAGQIGAHASAPQRTDAPSQRREHEHQHDQLDRRQHRLQPLCYLRRETPLLEQGAEGEVPRDGASLQQVVLEPHVDGPRRRTRTIERRRRELQTPTHGFIRSARGQPVVLHAVHSALLVTRTLALLVRLVAAGPRRARPSREPPEATPRPPPVVPTRAAPPPPPPPPPQRP